MTSPDANKPVLRADYLSPDDTTTFTEHLVSLPATHTTGAKTAYLAGLRASVAKLQNDVNVLLTEKMESDDRAPCRDAKAVQDAKQGEENYGEEELQGA